MKLEIEPVMGAFKTQFQKDAFKVLQEALLKSSIPLVLAEPDWNNPQNWSEQEKIIPDALTKIGLLYYNQLPY